MLRLLERTLAGEAGWLRRKASAKARLKLTANVASKACLCRILVAWLTNTPLLRHYWAMRMSLGKKEYWRALDTAQDVKPKFDH